MNSLPDFFPIELTAKTCAVSLVVFFVFAVPLAFYLSRSKSWVVKPIEFIVTLPLIFPPIALGYILLVVLGRNGIIGQVLDAAGFRVIFSEAGVFLAAFIAGLPLVVKPLQAAFSDPKIKELEQAAAVCGVSNLRSFFLVSLPLVRNSLMSGLLLGLARASGEVGITMMLGGNISDKTNTLSLEIFNSVSRGDFDNATFLCCLLAGFTALIYIALEVLSFSSKKF